MDVALGKPVTLASELKAAPITKDELAKFVGVYDLEVGFHYVRSGWRWADRAGGRAVGIPADVSGLEGWASAVYGGQGGSGD